MRLTAAVVVALALSLPLVTFAALTPAPQEAYLPEHLKRLGFRILRVRRNKTDWFRVQREGSTVPYPAPVLRGREVTWDVAWERRVPYTDFGYADDARKFVEQVAAKEYRKP